MPSEEQTLIARYKTFLGRPAQLDESGSDCAVAHHQLGAELDGQIHQSGLRLLQHREIDRHRHTSPESPRAAGQRLGHRAGLYEPCRKTRRQERLSPGGQALGRKC